MVPLEQAYLTISDLTPYRTRQLTTFRLAKQDKNKDEGCGLLSYPLENQG